MSSIKPIKHAIDPEFCVPCTMTLNDLLDTLLTAKDVYGGDIPIGFKGREIHKIETRTVSGDRRGKVAFLDFRTKLSGRVPDKEMIEKMIKEGKLDPQTGMIKK